MEALIYNFKLELLMHSFSSCSHNTKLTRCAFSSLLARSTTSDIVVTCLVRSTFCRTLEFCQKKEGKLFPCIDFSWRDEQHGKEGFSLLSPSPPMIDYRTLFCNPLAMTQFNQLWFIELSSKVSRSWFLPIMAFNADEKRWKREIGI